MDKKYENDITCPIDMFSSLQFIRNEISLKPELVFDLNFLKRLEVILSWMPRNPATDFQSLLLEVVERISNFGEIEEATLEKVLGILRCIRGSLLAEPFSNKFDEKLFNSLMNVLKSFSPHESLIRRFEMLTFTFDIKLDSRFDKISLKKQFLFILKGSLAAGDSKLSAKVISNLTSRFLLSNDDNENTSFLDEIFRLLENTRLEIEQDADDSSNLGKNECLAVGVHCLTSTFAKHSTLFNFDKFPIIKIIVQEGLASKQNYIRKVSRETLNMLVKIFATENDSIWMPYLNFLEVLEQKQVHLIKPALMNIHIFINRTQLEQLSVIGKFPFDFSWVLIAFRNGFHHLNGYVAKTIVVKYFQTPAIPVPDMADQVCRFLIDFVLPILNDGDLYQRCIDDNKLDQFLDSLKSYFSQIIENPKISKILFGNILLSLESRSWAPTPLFFLMHVLSTLPHSTPIWGEEVLEQLRSTFYAARQGSSPYFRTAVQESALTLASHLTDWNRCSPSKFCSNVLPFVPEQLYNINSTFFKNVTILWKDSSEKISFEQIVSLRNRNSRKAVSVASVICVGFQELLTTACYSINQYLSDDVECRPCLDFTRVDACLETLTDVILLSNTSLLQSIPSLNVENVLNYFSIRINEPFKPEDLSIWSTFETLIRLFIKCGQLEKVLSTFCNELLQNNAREYSLTQNFASMKLLNPFVEQTKLSSESRKFWICVLPLDGLNALHNLDSFDKAERQIFLSEYEKIRWKIVSRLLSIESFDKSIDVDFSLNFEQSIETIIEQFDRVDDETCTYLTNCLLSIVSILRLDYGKIARIIEIVQRVAFELNKSETYAAALSDLVSIMLIGFHRIETHERKLLKELIDKVLLQFFVEANQNNVVCLCAAKQFSWFSKTISGGCEMILENFGDVLFAFCTFGHVLRRDQKTLYAASDYLVKQRSAYQCNILLESEHLAAQKIRAFGLLLIENYFSNSRSNGNKIQLNYLIRMIQQKILELSEGKSSRKLYRSKFYPLSLCHRGATRALQLLLVLQPFVIDRNMAADLIKFCRDLLTADGQHGSVRLLLEWLIVRLLLTFPTLAESWLGSRDEMGLSRIGSLCSWVQVVMHVLLVIADEKDSEQFFGRACNSILPLCTAQNFTVRCCALSVLKRTWSVYRKAYDDNIVFQTLLDSCVNFSVEHRNATRHVEKQLADFYFSVFDVRKHYTLENVFRVLPLKCHLPEDETIELDVFENCFGAEIKNLTFISVKNETEELKSAESIIWNSGSRTLEEDEKFLPTRFDALQTKSLVDIDDFFTSTEGFTSDLVEPAHQANNVGVDMENKLIVVASLIDRPANLGGLCRTCEIFGATEYVIPSLKFVDDVQFQNLSVSSHRWVKIEEVRPVDLEVYLRQKQKQGFSIVGVEQTTSSVDLRNFEFPRKTILLLGNEKQGIPSYLIQNVLDFCVVIPQTGLIRSLNVHVAGAMLIWEYAKRHTLK